VGRRIRQRYGRRVCLGTGDIKIGGGEAIREGGERRRKIGECGVRCEVGGGMLADKETSGGGVGEMWGNI